MTDYRLFIAECFNCGAEYQVPSALPDEVRMAMRSESLAHFALVDVERDSQYRALWALACADENLSRLMDVQRVNVVARVFGWLCEPAPDGSAYSFCFPKKCPSCKSSHLRYGPSNPPRFMEANLPFVSHKKLDLMSREAALKLLHSAAEIELRP
jgi:hypothetical protein